MMINNNKSPLFDDHQHGQNCKEQRCLSSMVKLAPFLLYATSLTTIFLFFSPRFFPPADQSHLISVKSQMDQNCDLFTGHWVPDSRGPFYTNSSCATLPDSKNCFRHGRNNTDFLYWRWKPHGCELPRFNATEFFRLLRGKKMAFIGDSVARNHLDSLLCLLSQEEEPMQLYKDSEDRFGTWHFIQHNFTLMILWSKFLVASQEIMVNGSSFGYDLFVDQIDPAWITHLPALDYAIVSTGHWFNRPLFIHQGAENTTTKCVYCNQPNITSIGASQAVGLALRATFAHINGCSKCKDLVTLLRTFSPAHFEGGAWNTGGNCPKTNPYSEGEISLNGSEEWEKRSVQMSELEDAKRKAKERGKKFGVVDVTKAMAMRPDGHPGPNWGNRWMKGYNDCVHWCLPGAVDIWNDLMFAVLRRGVV